MLNPSLRFVDYPAAVAQITPENSPPKCKEFLEKTHSERKI
jgi:hypothetical protein